MSERSDTERQAFIKKYDAAVSKGRFFWNGHLYSDWWTIETLHGVFRHYNLDKTFDMAMVAMDAEEAPDDE